MEMEKEMSAEREILVRKIEELESLRAQTKNRLETARNLLSAKPWDAELDKDVVDLEHELACIEYGIESLKRQLS